MRTLPIALGDVNNDNHLDVIVAQPDNNNLHIFFGYGNGAFPQKPTTVIASSFTPYSIAVGDFNSDNRLDIAVAHYDNHSVGILIGHGNGTFSNKTVYSIGASRPLSLSVYDLNNDKHLDIVVVNDGTLNIGVLLGYGDGTFENSMMLSTGFDSLPHSVVAGDLNNDNRLDIIVANAGTNNIGVFLGNGNGNFSNQTIYAAGVYPVSVEVGDFNNDSRLDIVVGNNYGDNICILLGKGDGTFGSQSIYVTGFGSHPSSVIARDFNRDGRLDIAVANSDNNNIGLLLGNGDGTFNEQRIYTISIGAPQMIVAGDLNNDTWIDIVVSIDNSYNIGVFLGGSDRNFTNKTVYSTGPESYTMSVAVGDFNNDTKLDIVVANYGTDNLGILLGHGDGRFAVEILHPTGSGSAPSSVGLSDFNNDNRLDIVVTNYGTNNIGIFLGYGDGNFSNQTVYSTGSGTAPYSVAVGDFNNDNRLDIIVVNHGSDSLGIFLGNGDGSFSYQMLLSKGWASRPYVVATGEFNNDNRLDIVVANYGIDNLGIFLGNGDGTFSNQTLYSTGMNSKPCSVAVGDFNNDTRLDIVVTNYGSNVVFVILGNGDGKFSNNKTYSIGKGAMSIVIGDMNNDTYLDFIVANFYDNDVGVLLGKGDGTFSEQVTYSTGWDSEPYSVAIGDFNGDTRLDVVVALYFYYSIGIFLGYYNSPFTIPVIYSGGLVSTPFALAVANFDNDSCLDIVSANQDNGDIAIYLNSGNGIFQSSTLYSTGYPTSLSSVATGDFNNDNITDIVTANPTAKNIAIFLGLGNGNFENAMIYATLVSSGPCSITVSDFNSNGLLDIVGASNEDNTIIVFLHFGFGAFMSQEIYPTATDTPSHSIASGDFNKDNRLDLVVTNWENSTITVLLGIGDGTFSNQTTYYTGRNSAPFMVVTADFNNDTQLDLAVVNRYGAYVSIFLGNGDGTFQNQTMYYTGTSSQPFALNVGDLNNDGYLDMVVSNEATSYISVFFGNSDGTFKDAVVYPTGHNSQPWGIVIDDFNNDTQADIAVANCLGFNVGIFLGNGNGTFLDQTTYSTGHNSFPHGLSLADFNNDNRIDLVAANYGGDNVGVFLGNGDGTFLEQTTYSTGHLSGPYWLAVGDFNKDGQLDIAIALSLSDSLAICFGKGNGTFSSPAIFGTGSSTYPWSLTVADFNHDSWLDVAVVLGDVAGVAVLLGDAKRIFLVHTTYSTYPGSAPQAVVAGDLNNDKHIDVVVACSRSNNIVLFLGYGNGRLSNPVTYSTGIDSQPWSVAIGYLNKDTWLDIVVANSNSSNIGVFLGHGYGIFGNATMYSTSSLSDLVSIAILDFNRDNKLDIAVANYLPNSVDVFLGQGDGTFFNQTTYLAGYNSNPVSIAVGDFNMDGWIDIAVAALGTKNIKILSKSC